MGLDLVRMTWFRAAPASPDGRSSTWIPVCFVNAASTLLEAANESWVTSRIVTDGGDAPLAGTAAASRARVTARTARRLMIPPVHWGELRGASPRGPGSAPRAR